MRQINDFKEIAGEQLFVNCYWFAMWRNSAVKWQAIVTLVGSPGAQFSAAEKQLTSQQAVKLTAWSQSQSQKPEQRESNTKRNNAQLI